MDGLRGRDSLTLIQGFSTRRDLCPHNCLLLDGPGLTRILKTLVGSIE